MFDYIDGYTGEAKDGFIDAKEIHNFLTESITMGFMNVEVGAISEQLFGF